MQIAAHTASCADRPFRVQIVPIMLYEPTTLASVARLIQETLERDYTVDSKDLFSEIGIDTRQFSVPGARFPVATMGRLWEAAAVASDDPYIGLNVGRRVKPSDFYVLGHAWMASATLEGAFGRLCRYRKVLSTLHGILELVSVGDQFEFRSFYPAGAVSPPREARDGGYAAFFSICDAVTSEAVRPIRASLIVPPEYASDRYETLFECPISYGSDQNILVYSAADLESQLSGWAPDVADAVDRITEHYIDTLDESQVSTTVRSLLVKLLPAGRTDQETVASRLYRSTSTLQRQLNAEGTSYREVLESTRKVLAEQYLKEGGMSKAEIAFLVGFADQSNFSRAFKRWMGVSPSAYRN